MERLSHKVTKFLLERLLPTIYRNIRHSGQVVCWYLILFISTFDLAWSWGFLSHRMINKQAIFLLPQEMVSFYKHHLYYITENAVNPDKRRYAVDGEAPRHFIDLEHYGDDISNLPQSWGKALEQYGNPTLQEHGILPWHIVKMKGRLTQAFRHMEVYQILRLSADIGHYIADAHVPLHTTENYNGQLTNQEGIHGFWETRLPELFLEQYDFFIGPATYLSDPQKHIWQAIEQAHRAVPILLEQERQLANSFNPAKRYSFEQKGTCLTKVYSVAYATSYHQRLNGQVEQQLRASIKMVADFWYTCWVDAGRPNLSALLPIRLETERLQEVFDKTKRLKIRDCGD